MTTDIDCQVTLLTPRGRGAIASISVTGNQAVDLVERFFLPRGRRSLRSTTAREILVGQWRSGKGPPEEVVVSRRDETHVEVHCHGGLAAQQALITSLADAGAVLRGDDGWLQEQESDAIRRAALQAISQARTERAAAILLDQWRGALAAGIEEIRELLRPNTVSLDAAARRIGRMVQLGDVGLHLTRPWRVVLAGPPNVGKSSLVNALLGYERCIVFDQPGTTRDVLTATTAIDGWAIELTDTAGYRESQDAVEQEGTRRAWQQVQEADLTVIVLDATQPTENYLQPFRKSAHESLVVVNKIDQSRSTDQFPRDFVLTSAITRAGVDELAKQIVTTLVPDPPQRGEAVPFTQQQVEWLNRAHLAISSGDREAGDEFLLRLLHPD